MGHGARAFRLCCGARGLAVMQRYRDAELGEANQGGAAHFERMKWTCAAKLEAPGDHYGVSMTKAGGCDPVFEVDQVIYIFYTAFHNG